MSKSIEALERLLCMAKKGCKVDMCNVKYVENASDIVKKDLEVLEILKKHYDKDSLILSLGYFMAFHIHNDDNDFNKIKEWLENGN